MAGSSFGDIFKISSFGESHGEYVGVVIEGCPSGLLLNEKDIQVYLDRRKAKLNSFSTSRKEDDICKIISGTFENKTTGAPITVIVKNTDHNPSEYDKIKDIYRPGHADYTYHRKYEHYDYRGGGRSSGRETISRVIAGAVANKILKSLDIEVLAFTQSIGDINIKHFDMDARFENPFFMPDNQAAHLASFLVNNLKEENDSIGGIISCLALSVPAGLGEPVFDKLDAKISSAMLSIGGVKGIEFGAGFNVAKMKASQNNDEFFINEDFNISKKTNNSGGILGGISDGSPIIFNLAIKACPSIKKQQKTVDKNKNEVQLTLNGRYDTLIVPRIVVVAESMLSICLVDFLFKNMNSKMDNIIKIYKS